MGCPNFGRSVVLAILPSSLVRKPPSRDRVELGGKLGRPKDVTRVGILCRA
jgi:hypothetical protein